MKPIYCPLRTGHNDPNRSFPQVPGSNSLNSIDTLVPMPSGTSRSIPERSKGEGGDSRPGGNDIWNQPTSGSVGWGEGAEGESQEAARGPGE